MSKFALSIFFITLLSCPSNKEVNEQSYRLGAIGAFGEAVNAGVKQLAISATMSVTEMNSFRPEDKDIPAMEKFYQDVLGVELVVDQGWAKIYQASETGYIGLVDERRGMLRHTETKAVNVSFILNDLDGWFNYVKSNQSFTLRSTEISTGPERKYRAFVGYDPEGYYMEFDTFYDHSDNKSLLKYLER